MQFEPRFLIREASSLAGGMRLNHSAVRGMSCGFVGFILLLAFTSSPFVPLAMGLDPSPAYAMPWGIEHQTCASAADSGDEDAGDEDKWNRSDTGARFVPLPGLDGSWSWVIPILLIPGRLRRNRLLENPLRRQILEAVRKDPGIHHRELLRTLGISNGTLAYHLRTLERGGYIRALTAHGRKLLWAPEAKVDVNSLLLTDRERELLEVLSTLRTARSDELGRRIGLKPSSVEYHVNRLRALRFVQSFREGHALVFVPTVKEPTPKLCTTNHSSA